MATSDVDGLKAEVESLKVSRLKDAKKIRDIEEYIDTVSSPMWKRIWFVLQGYRWRRVGRWYGKTEDLK